MLYVYNGTIKIKKFYLFLIKFCEYIEHDRLYKIIF